MITRALVLLALAGCSVEVDGRPAPLPPPVTDSDRYDPRQDVLEDDREGEGIALEAAVAYYQAKAPELLAGIAPPDDLRIRWVAGVECPSLETPNPDRMFLDHGDRGCSRGVIWGSCESIFVVLDEAETIGLSAYAHEIGHCMSLLAGEGIGAHDGPILRHALGASVAVRRAFGELDE